MTRHGIEPWSPTQLANTLLTRPVSSVCLIKEFIILWKQVSPLVTLNGTLVNWYRASPTFNVVDWDLIIGTPQVNS